MGLRSAAERSRRKRSLLAAASWIPFILLAAAWFAFLRPPVLGGTTGYVIVSGASMEPLLHTGDLAVVHPSSEYRPGDVVAYRIPEGDLGHGMLVIHRIAGGDATRGFVLQGDNRDYADMWHPTGTEVVGTLRWYVPHVGTALFLLRSPIVLAAVLGFATFWAIGMREQPLDGAAVPRHARRARRALQRAPIPVADHPLIVRRRALAAATTRV